VSFGNTNFGWLRAYGYVCALKAVKCDYLVTTEYHCLPVR